MWDLPTFPLVVSSKVGNYWFGTPAVTAHLCWTLLQRHLQRSCSSQANVFKVGGMKPSLEMPKILGAQFNVMPEN